ncbi:hypothetical protein ACTMU2_19970 [Cupriavidus basilensis]
MPKTSGLRTPISSKERALLAARAALPWERAHVSALFGLLEDPYTNLAATEAYIAANSSDLLVISQLCGYLIFYGGARKLERVLNIMESADPNLRDDWAWLARLGFAASEAGDQEPWACTCRASTAAAPTGSIRYP